jgi:hypothetical protein
MKHVYVLSQSLAISMGETRTAYKILVVKPEGKRPLIKT